MALLLCASATVSALDSDLDLRLVPQILFGTSGVEPGVAMEWRGPTNPLMVIRPELLISEDGQLGAGGAILYDLTPSMSLPAEQSFAVGPRVVYHNADESGWEADAMATWSYALSGGMSPGRHQIGAIAALGVCRDPENDENDLGASAGAFYSYRF